VKHDGRSEFAKRLAKQRRTNFLTQRELAKRMGVTQATVARWEIGQYTPALHCRKQLATVLNIDPNILFEGADDEAVA
jgi:transcriptional regulator with XRE-family HTH domain